MSSKNSEDNLAFRMKGITKKFAFVKANDNVDFSVLRGEIHALVGENGAGKSTLMNVLSGLYKADSGEIWVSGRKIEMDSPRDAISVGIGMVHQHFMLIGPLTVAENVILGRESLRLFGFIDVKKVGTAIGEISRRFGLNVDPLAKVETLSVGMEQRVEILKTLYQGISILILDEPTQVLSPQETEELFSIMRKLREEGKTVVFITHKLSEVMAVSDRVTVMRNGKVVGVLETKSTTKQELANMMVGREVFLQIEKRAEKPGVVILEVKSLSTLSERGSRALKDISFKVRSGEIVGIAGVEGNGQTELVEAITGLRRISSGSVSVCGKELSRGAPKSFLGRGISHIPEDRQKRGLILDFPISDNLVMGLQSRRPFSGFIWLRRGAIAQNASRLIEAFGITPPRPELPARNLSGGNQQKVVVARELSRDSRLLVAAQPTRGLDVAASEFIHRSMLKERGAGKGILFVSADLSEILSLSDRILVMFGGQIVRELEAGHTDEGEIGLLMTGGAAPIARKG
ncbi:MAG: ABC transporter ATP-binding protein [Candidatus Eisenbacteria bacterium]|nr:ABC transporter ATP-binding protein [Candidatus Eisenbacteria bacterium]